MSQTISLPLLDQVRVASPCPAKWSDMVGDDVTRHCAQCDLNVHNLSAMSGDDAEAFLGKLGQERVCIRFYRRADGTILTRDCPMGLAAARRRLLRGVSRIAAAIGLAVLAGTFARAAEDKSWGNWEWSIRLTNTQPIAWVTGQLQEWRWRMFPSTRPNWTAGAMLMDPPLPAPPWQSYGPHGLEWRR